MNSHNKIRESRGSILIFVLVVATIVGGATFVLLDRANTELTAQQFEANFAQARATALGALEIARNAIDTAGYDTDDHNIALWAADSSADGVYGGYLVDNTVSAVRVSYLGNSWFELTAIATVGDVAREIRQRVRERDYYSRFGVYIAEGNVSVGDTSTFYGAFHCNKNVIFNDSVTGVGAQMYGTVTSTLGFTFNANAQAETMFYAGYADNLGAAGWIDMPEVTSITDLKNSTGAWGAGSTQIYQKTGAGACEFRSGPGGFSIVGNVYTYINFINDPGNRSKVSITIKTTSGTQLYTGVHNIPQEGVIHVGDNGYIKGIKGQVNGRVTVCSESSIEITSDLVYEDNNDQKAMLFDPANPANNNYLPNPDYTGNASLGLIAKNDVLWTGADDDANLEVNGAMMALTSQVKWGGTGVKGHLRTFGAICSNNQPYRASGGNGYNSSGVYIYDDRMRINPPPSFLTAPRALYMGLEIVK